MTGGGEAETRARSSCRERCDADGADRLTSGGCSHCSRAAILAALCLFLEALPQALVGRETPIVLRLFSWTLTSRTKAAALGQEGQQLQQVCI